MVDIAMAYQLVKVSGCKAQWLEWQVTIRRGRHEIHIVPIPLDPLFVQSFGRLAKLKGAVVRFANQLHRNDTCGIHGQNGRRAARRKPLRPTALWFDGHVVRDDDRSAVAKTL
jgi:hypothetical protein